MITLLGDCLGINVEELCKETFTQKSMIIHKKAGMLPTILLLSFIVTLLSEPHVQHASNSTGENKHPASSREGASDNLLVLYKLFK